MSQITYSEIIDSHTNGQLQQMADQINDFAVYDFLTYLESDDELSDSTKFEILKKYLRLTHK